jgi:hypothetical protein
MQENYVIINNIEEEIKCIKDSTDNHNMEAINYSKEVITESPPTPKIKKNI